MSGDISIATVPSKTKAGKFDVIIMVDFKLACPVLRGLDEQSVQSLVASLAKLQPFHH